MMLSTVYALDTDSQYVYTDEAISDAIYLFSPLPLWWRYLLETSLCAAGVELKGTLLFCAVSDEEAQGEDGAK